MQTRSKKKTTKKRASRSDVAAPIEPSRELVRRLLGRVADDLDWLAMQSEDEQLGDDIDDAAKVVRGLFHSFAELPKSNDFRTAAAVATKSRELRSVTSKQAKLQTAALVRGARADARWSAEQRHVEIVVRSLENVPHGADASLIVNGLRFDERSKISKHLAKNFPQAGVWRRGAKPKRQADEIVAGALKRALESRSLDARAAVVIALRALKYPRADNFNR